MSRKKGRNSYSKEFKETAVELVLSGSKSQRKIADELGINVNTLQNWKREYLDSKDPKKVKAKEEEAEIRRLKKELYEAKLENEILKKAVGYFSKDQL